MYYRGLDKNLCVCRVRILGFLTKFCDTMLNKIFYFRFLCINWKLIHNNETPRDELACENN